jgi:DNA-binding phage protein
MTPEIRMAIESAIKAQGRQRAWVAEQAGVTYVQFTRMMRGSSEGSVQAWRRMLDALGLELYVRPKGK